MAWRPRSVAHFESEATARPLSHASWRMGRRGLISLTRPLLRIWTGGGLAAADGALLGLALPLFETEDVKSVLPAAVEAFTAGLPRPTFKFKGR